MKNEKTSRRRERVMLSQESQGKESVEAAPMEKMIGKKTQVTGVTPQDGKVKRRKFDLETGKPEKKNVKKIK